MNILGISCFYHDASACLVSGGHLVAAAQEERFTRNKHDADFPIHAINYCVQSAQVTFGDIDVVAFYEKPYLKFHRVLMDHIYAWPKSFRSFHRAMPFWLQDRLSFPLLLERELGYKGKVLFIDHHLSHAASAFCVSPFEEAAILTADGVGEWATTTYGFGTRGRLKLARQINYPSSLGLLYTAVTTYLGFKANGGEGKVMGLAGYGQPAYLDAFERLIHVEPDGSFRLEPSFFAFSTGASMFSRKFEKLFGLPRKPEEPFDKRHHDIAATLQKVTEDVAVAMARHLHRETKSENLCLAGGTFLNCLANRKILEQTPFRSVFIQPAAGDGGAAIGAATYVDQCLFNNPRVEVLEHVYLGPEYSDEEIHRQLKRKGLDGARFTEDQFVSEVAQAIADNLTVGWFQGRMEFGPRALGNRSILGNPCHPEMKDILNQRIKKRESFRPFAPAVLEEKAGDYFDLAAPSPFMLLAPTVKAEQRSKIPSVTHVDGTARVQTVSSGTNPRFYKLLGAFEKLCQVPIVINTSFNQRGEPIVCTPEDALNCFARSDLDVLAIGDRLIRRRPNNGDR